MGVVEVRIGDETRELSWDDWEDRVRAGRIPPDADVRFAAVTGEAFVPAHTLESYQSLRDDGAATWRAQLGRRAPLVTALLVGVQIRIWWTAKVPGASQWLADHLTKWTAPTLEDGEVWRLLTMGLLHLDLPHITMNMLFMGYTSLNLERALGWRNLVFLFTVSVLGGSLASTWGAPGSPSLGASGGVFGLIAASVVFGFSRPDLLPDRYRRAFGFALLPYLVIMFVSGLYNASTDNWAHFGGLVTGLGAALLVDPEPLQRRPGWNRRVRGLAAAGVAILLATLAVAGPRFILLEDADRARLALRGDTMEPDPDRPLRWSVPQGWRPATTLSGHTGFGSPAGPRVWSVRRDDLARPTPPAQRLQQLVDDLSERFDAVEAGPLTPSTLAGHEATAVTLTVRDGDETVLLERTEVVQGIHVLTATFQVDAASADRLASLRRRLLDRVAWDGPRALDDARIRHERAPRAPDRLADYARALGAAGQVEAAQARWDERLALGEIRPALWEQVFEVVRYFPDRTARADAWIAQALTAPVHPRTLVAVAEALEALDRDDAAEGLLLMGWLRHPGDRTLRRARRGRGLGTTLADDGTAIDATWDVLADAPYPDDLVAHWRSAPLTLDNAARAGARVRQDRQALVARIAEALADPTTPAEALVRPLQLLRLGRPPHRPEAREVLDIALTSRSTPSWWPEALPPRDEVARRLGIDTESP